MSLSLHAASIMHTNLAADVRAAKTAGYQGIEAWIPKLARYLDAGYGVEDLIGALGPLRVTMLDVLMPIERSDPEFRTDLLRECARMSAVAEHLGCPAIQVVALDGFADPSPAGLARTMIASLGELADVAAPHGVRLGLEPVTFSPFHDLAPVLEVIETVGRDRVGLVLDTWHLWTSGVPWDAVAELDPALIVCVQLSDTNPKQGARWSDDDRTALPGDGLIPLREAVEAVRSTGFDGVWSVEMLSRRHWEWDPEVLAIELRRRAAKLLAPAVATG